MTQSNLAFKFILLLFIAFIQHRSQVQAANECSVSSSNTSDSNSQGDAANVKSSLQLKSCGKTSIDLENSLSVSDTLGSSGCCSTSNSQQSGGQSCSTGENSTNNTSQTVTNGQCPYNCSPCSLVPDLFDSIDSYYGITVNYSGTVPPPCCCISVSHNQALTQPYFAYDAEPDEYYSVFFVTLDSGVTTRYPSTVYVVLNSPGNDTSRGQIPFPYTYAEPPLQRLCTTVMLQQTGYVNFSLVDDLAIVAGVAFDLNGFNEKYDLKPIKGQCVLVKLE